MLILVLMTGGFPVKNSVPSVLPNTSFSAPVTTAASATTVANSASINSSNNQRYRYQSEIQAMMYTFGDVRHPLPVTTLLIEDIVHSQIIELLMRVSGIVSRRGARTITPEDLLFLLRHDVNRSARLKEFLSWKDVRKNAKATSGAEAGGDGAAGGNSGEAGEGGIGDDSALVAEIEEDAKTLAASDSTAQDYDSRLNDSDSRGGSSGSNPSSSNKSVQIGPKRRQLGLFWDLGHGLLADLPGNTGSFNDGTSLTSYDSRDQATCQRETLRRLRHADLLTLSMSQAEYMEYSECRQASFTYKKARKFRDWLVGGTARPGSLGLSSLAAGSARDLAKLSDDTLEILGFLAYEIVQKLTEVSLAVKYEYEKMEISSESVVALANQVKSSGTQIPNSSLGGIFTYKASETPQPVPAATQKYTKTPIQTVHVEEAYRKLISANIDGFNLFRHSLNKKRKFIL